MERYSYKILVEEQELTEIFWRMSDENLLWAFFPEFEPEELSEAAALAILGRQEALVLGGYVDGALAGILTLSPLRYRSRAGEVGVLAFRKYFGDALPLCVGALEWVFRTQAVDALVGYIPVASRQSLRLYTLLGFERLGRIPGMYWYTRKQKFLGAEVVVLTRETVEEEGYGRRWAELSGSGTCTGKAGNEEFERGCAGGCRCSASETAEKSWACRIDSDNEGRRITVERAGK